MFPNILIDRVRNRNGIIDSLFNLQPTDSAVERNQLGNQWVLYDILVVHFQHFYSYPFKSQASKPLGWVWTARSGFQGCWAVKNILKIRRRMLNAQIYTWEPWFKHLGLHTLFLLFAPLKSRKLLPCCSLPIINPNNLKVVHFAINQPVNSVNLLCCKLSGYGKFLYINTINLTLVLLSSE